MKQYIELTSIAGNTRAFRLDSILQVVNQVVFEPSDYENHPSLKEREEWVYIIQQCTCALYYVQESYADVMKKIEEAIG